MSTVRVYFWFWISLVCPPASSQIFVSQEDTNSAAHCSFATAPFLCPWATDILEESKVCDPDGWPACLSPQGIVRAIKDYQGPLKEHEVTIFVRRGGPNYQEGLRVMGEVGEWDEAEDHREENKGIQLCYVKEVDYVIIE